MYSKEIAGDSDSSGSVCAGCFVELNSARALLQCTSYARKKGSAVVSRFAGSNGVPFFLLLYIALKRRRESRGVRSGSLAQRKTVKVNYFLYLYPPPGKGNCRCRCLSPPYLSEGRPHAEWLITREKLTPCSHPVLPPVLGLFLPFHLPRLPSPEMSGICNHPILRIRRRQITGLLFL